jgi:hypothetical protein
MKSKILISIYLAFTFVFLFGVLMSFYDYSYYGYWSDKIINWSWLVLTVMVILLSWRNKITRIYFFSLLTLITLSILPMGIPFFGIIYNFSTIDDYQQIKLNDTYRIETTKQQSLSLPRIYVYKRIGILEKNICRPIYQDILMNTLKLKEYTKDTNRKISIQKAKFITINNDSIGIDYQILDEEKIIYHKLKNDDGY